MNHAVAVLGGGHGAHAMAADLVSRGFSVNLFEMPEFQPNLARLFDTRTIHASGVIQGSFMSPDPEHRQGASESEIVEQLRQFASEHHTDVYVVTNNWEPTVFGPPLAHFDRHLESDERSAESHKAKCCATSMRSKPDKLRIPTS